MVSSVSGKNVLERRIGISKNIVNAQYDLGVSEKTIIYLALAGINQTKPIEVGAWHVVELEDFATLRGKKEDIDTLPMRRDHAKVELNLATKSLYNSSIKLVNPEGVREEHRWITGYKETGTYNSIALKWNPDLLPYLAELKAYANLLTSDLIGIKGRYASRILELCSQGKSKGRKEGSVEVELEDFLDMCLIEGAYRDFKYLNLNVLKPSIKELRSKGVVDIELRTKKEGRFVKVLIFDYKFI